MKINIRRPLIWVLSIFVLVLLFLNTIDIPIYYRTDFDEVLEEKEGFEAQVIATVENITDSVTGIKVTLSSCEVRIKCETKTDSGEEACEGMCYKPDRLVSYFESTRASIKSADGSYAAEGNFVVGDRVEISGTIKKIDTPDNPGEFNSFQYYRCRGIFATLYPESCLVLSNGSGVRATLYRIRQSLYDAVDEVSESEEEAGLYKAFLFGDKSSLDEDTYETFQICGIAHILAVGGLHLTILAEIILRIVRRFLNIYKKFRKTPFLVEVIASIVADIFLLFFVLMIDGSVSAWRAYIMFTLYIIAPLIHRTRDTLSAIGLSGIIILLLQPLYVLDCAFQLSFAAIIGVGVLFPRLKNIAEELRPREENGRKKDLGFVYYRIITPLLFSTSIQLVTIPIALCNFYAISLYGIFLNLIIIPLMTVIIGTAFGAVVFVAGAGGGLGLAVGTQMSPVITIGRFFAGSSHYFFKILIRVCEFVQELPGAKLVLGKPDGWRVIIYYVLLSVVMILLGRQIQEEIRNKLYKIKNPITVGSTEYADYEIPHRSISKRFFAVVILIPALILISVNSKCFEKESITLAALYVGQGDSTVVTLPNGHAVIFDAGSSSKKNVAKSIILPYLKSSAITDVDMIILSHPDIDHINGVVKILESEYVDVGGVAVSAVFSENSALSEIKEACQSAKVPFYSLNASDEISFSSERVKVTALSPSTLTNSESPGTGKGASSSTSSSKNDGSLVVRLRYGDFSALFTGDISSDEEKDIAKSGTNLSATYLKCPHHGSKYSSSSDFLAAVHPLVTTVSAGRGNTYGHPTKEALDRIATSGSAIYITKTQGAILTSVSSLGRLNVKTYRKADES